MAKLDLEFPDFWAQRYQTQTTGWDLGQTAPPLADFLPRNLAAPPGRAIVLGCGRGYEVIALAKLGFAVVGVDFAPEAIAAATTLAQDALSQDAFSPTQGMTAEFWQQDIFELLPDGAQQFDLVLEHTCFCALNPQRRAAYGELVAQLVRPQGHFLGLFWPHDRPGGPPFGSTLAEIRALLDPHFIPLSAYCPTNSVAQRHNEEYLYYGVRSSVPATVSHPQQPPQAHG